MSYTIVYDRQFINTGDGRYIALALAGSNNCYQQTSANRWKRERYWTPILTSSGVFADGNTAGTEEEMLHAAESRCGGEFQEHFKWRGKWVDDKGLMLFVKNGIKSALTLEELNETSLYDVCLRCYLSIWYTDGETYASGTLMQKNKEELQCTVRTSEELITFLAAAGERYAQRADNEEIYASLEFPDEKAVPYPKEPRFRKAQERLVEFYVLKLTSGGAGYIKKLTGRSLNLTFNTQAAKQFKTEKDALKWLEKYDLAKKFRASFDVEYVAG